MSRENIMNTYGRFDLELEKGFGTKVVDVEGKEYIDFISGVAVNALGHSHPAIIKTITEQSQKIMHVSNNFWTTPLIDLGGKLAQYSDHDQTFFCNSGTEANEVALKIARKYGKVHGNENKTKIIYTNNSFHGRTMGAVSVTGQDKYKKDFMPLIPDTIAIDYNDIEGLKNVMNENTCAIILETIQGEGGIIKGDNEFLQEARNLCDKYNALLIFDEVQTGIGRLGTLFAYENFGVIPDVITMAKGLGGGFPIGACLANKKAGDVLKPGDHGNTFGGNPLACAVSLTVLDEIMNKGVLENVNAMGDYLVANLNHLKEKYSTIKEIRGMGLLIGMQIEGNLKDIQNKCFEKGLLLATAGQDVIRFLPPLNITKEEMDAMLTVLESTLEELK